MIPIAAPWLVALASLFLLPPPAQDAKGCKDHPLFNCMPNYEIYLIRNF